MVRKHRDLRRTHAANLREHRRQIHAKSGDRYAMHAASRALSDKRSSPSDLARNEPDWPAGMSASAYPISGLWTLVDELYEAVELVRPAVVHGVDVSDDVAEPSRNSLS